MKTTAKSTNSYNAKSSKSYSAKSDKGVRLIATKMWGSIEVPESMSSKSHPYMYGSMRVRDPKTGVRVQHVGVVINRMLVKYNIRTAVFADIANGFAERFGARVTTSDLNNYMSGACQPKMDKLLAITEAMNTIQAGYTERDTTGWTDVSAKQAYWTLDEAA